MDKWSMEESLDLTYQSREIEAPVVDSVVEEEVDLVVEEEVDLAVEEAVVSVVEEVEDLVVAFGHRGFVWQSCQQDVRWRVWW